MTTTKKTDTDLQALRETITRLEARGLDVRAMREQADELEEELNTSPLQTISNVLGWLCYEACNGGRKSERVKDNVRRTVEHARRALKELGHRGKDCSDEDESEAA